LWGEKPYWFEGETKGSKGKKELIKRSKEKKRKGVT
jgi:hypothetical protein